MSPKFNARRRESGTWFIEATWPNGKKEEIGKFATAEDANAEIKSRLDAFEDGERRFQKPLAAPRVRAPAES